LRQELKQKQKADTEREKEGRKEREKEIKMKNKKLKELEDELEQEVKRRKLEAEEHEILHIQFKDKLGEYQRQTHALKSKVSRILKRLGTALNHVAHSVWHGSGGFCRVSGRVQFR
jgi:hypothetical protein